MFSIIKLTRSYLTLLIVIVLCCANTKTQANSIQCTPIDNVVPGFLLTPSMSHFWDKNAQLEIPQIDEGHTLSNIAQAYNFKAIPNASNETYLGEQQSNHWLRFCLTNTTTKQQNLVLTISPPVMAKVDFYPQKPGLKSFQTGSSKKTNTRDLNSADFHFRISLDPSEQQDFFVRINAVTNAYITAHLWDQVSYSKNKDWNETKFGIFSGVVIGLILYNFLLFISLRKLSSLYYIGWSISIFLMLSSLDGRLLQYALPNNPQLWLTLTMLLYPVASLFAALFAGDFIKIKEHPKLNVIGKFLISIMLVLLVISYPMGVDAYFTVCAFFALTVIVFFGFFAPIYCLLKYKSQASKHLLITQIPLMLIMIDHVLFAFGLTAQFHLPYTPKTGVILAMILISYYIGSSIHKEKDDAQQLALEQMKKSNELKSRYNTQLEHEIKSKTSDILELNSDLEKQAQKLRDMDNVKSKFFANISHEFRTPLTLIEGPLTMLLEQDSLNSKELIEGALRNSKSLEHLINQLLLLSEFDENTANLKASKVDIVKTSHEFTAQFESLLARKNVNLRFESSHPQINTYVDSEKLQIIINNLISNALKFSEENSTITVALRTTTNDKLLSDDFTSDEYVEIAVSDTGPGIPESELPFVFDRYFQSESSELSKSGLGTGIGLALVKELVNLHAGQVSVESVFRDSNSHAQQASSGTTFSIMLPLGKAHLTAAEIQDPIEITTSHAIHSATNIVKKELATKEPVHTETSLATTQQSEATQEPKATVLVVDDNDDMRRYITRLLETDYTVIVARDGLIAEDQLKTHSPDIIITDLMMPNRNGLELVESLKKDNEFAKIPVIMLSARAGLDDRINGLLAAVDDYLVKPFNARELKVRIENLLDKQARFSAFYGTQLKPQQQLSTPEPSHDNTENNSAPEEDNYLIKVRAVVDEKLIDPDFNVNQLAAALHISEATLRRKLSEHAKSTPAAFIRHCRLDKARQISEQGTIQSISELAYAVGFTQASYFSRLYQKTFNKAPFK